MRNYLLSIIPFLLICFSIERDQNQARDLIVKKENSPYVHSNGVFFYDKIMIEKGAELIFENFNGWNQLIVSGDVTIDGKIILRNWEARLNTVSTTAVDGTELTYTYLGGKIGGNGGSNEYAGHPTGTVKYSMGAKGTIEYGGGGGSGCGDALYWPTSAVDWKGAIPKKVDPGFPKGGNGGNGGVGVPLAGGLLFIKINGGLYSNAGEVIAVGQNGVNGENGENSSCINWRRSVIDCSFPGQGGGGGPGGDGGAIFIFCHNVKSLPNINVNGGEGGEGGEGGVTKKYRSDETMYRGVSGENGQRGNNGIVRIKP